MGNRQRRADVTGSYEDTLNEVTGFEFCCFCFVSFSRETSKHGTLPDACI